MRKIKESDEGNWELSRNGMHSRDVAQWITSLAISVICCAILFIVFAGYIVNLHDKANLQEVRVEMLKDRINQLSMDITALRMRPLPAAQAQATETSPAPASVAQPTSEPQKPEEPKLDSQIDQPGKGVVITDPAPALKDGN
ncbi:MAG: hypothetical protein EOM37_00410 [Proteobacteria bacterium]|jgi:uncharacterized membrane protein|nr:hypothetical protein [Alphaproteobacteria bacterium]NCC02502.1 hypothetical protein [Pseudomonadota bacterium]